MPDRKYIDSIEVNVVDSFVSAPNKTGSGNGETRLYVGARNVRGDFFGKPGFKIPVRLKKSELIRFMNEMKDEYEHPLLDYRGKADLTSLWEQRVKKINDLPEENIDFYVFDTQLKSPTSDKQRIYIDSDDSSYHLLHELPLSGSARLNVVKYEDSGRHFYEFKLVPDFDGYSISSKSIPISTKNVSSGAIGRGRNSMVSVAETTIERIIQARVGQVNFRKALLSSKNSACAFTGIAEASLLIAGHIKPWSVCSNAERLDVQNGLLFTPTYDRLFNNGFISFKDDKKLIISPLLNRKTTLLLGLKPDMQVEVPLDGRGNARRRSYMEYHRNFVYRD
jgi:hypothetical protein